LSIAGSDPSGGAGIQADLKTFLAVGVYGAAAITCLTAQNSQGVYASLPLEPEFVRRQVELVLADLTVSHVKTGMLGTNGIALAIVQALRDFSGEVICDPVFRASDGHPLFTVAGQKAGLQALLERATVLTPNLPELAELTAGSTGSIATLSAALEAAASLLDHYGNLRAVVLTGGHLPEEEGGVVDSLILRGHGGREIFSVRHPRIRTTNTHGTGCTFASAFTAYHLLSNDDRTAFARAVAFMDQVMRKSAGLALGRGKGPLAHHLFREQEEPLPLPP
jgi:hydroxymethylpyrimidine/phosphomethylpyrimidine kinase